MLLQELNSSTPARAPGLGLTGIKALSPFVSGLIVSDGEWGAADNIKDDQWLPVLVTHPRSACP
jgi:hypothetical protein